MKGGNHARNYGFSLSSGEYIQWLDADDQLAQGKFLAQLQFFHENPECSVVYSDWELHTYQDLKLVKKEYKKNTFHQDMLLELLKDNWSSPNTYLIKRQLASALMEAKAWNPLTAVGQDREYFTTAAIMGAKFGYVPGYFAIYNRWNKTSVSAVSQEIRFTSMGKMLTHFEELLDHQYWPTEQQKNKYKIIIHTQKLMIASFGYPVSLQRDQLHLHTIDWLLISGFRTRLKMVFTFAKLKLKYGK
jgi:glycosyltransferase involved in cell wall biosynthesis